ncbi:uncharacterized protein [Rutidosis leptorrhynchoides]|uniref:uncharacterized protein n=1 Tax=Rutidosis leptorrhynchoides TaxID=125765 RepID=UPI003A9A62F1
MYGSSGNQRSTTTGTVDDLMREVTHMMNNPDYEREMVRNNPHLRELVHGNPENFRNIVNDPALDPQIREIMTNPDLFRQTVSNLRAAPPQNQAAQNPATATTGGALETTAVDTGIALKPTVSLNVRVLNGPSFTVKASLEASVRLFKSVLEKHCDVPAGEQRLVHKGRIFYEEESTLKSYGLKADDTVHLVRGTGGLGWFQRTPSPLLGRRAHIIQAMHDSNPQFKAMVRSPEFNRMFPPSMNIEQTMTLQETAFAMFTRGPVPPEEKYVTQLAQVEEMGFTNARDSLDALTAHSGNVYAAVELLEILSKYH